MIKEPIYQGRLQSDLDFNGFNPVNLSGWPPSGSGGGGGINQIVNGQNYIEIVFNIVQPDALWEITRATITNTVDFAPINIMPGVLTAKSTGGFRMQLSGRTDTANYYLHWGFTGTSGGTTAAAPTGAYTIIDTTVSGDTTRIIVPTVRVTGTAVVYCHGLGETPTGGAFDPVTSDKHLYMSGALANGYLLVSGLLGGELWSNATAQSKLETLVAYLVANYAVNHVVLWSMSAGGCVGLLKATQGFSGVTVPGWFGIYPIVDLDVAHGNAALTASINAAFPAYPTDAAGRDPKLLPAANYNGLRLRCCESPTDAAAPKASHGDALVTLTAGHAIETACVATSGPHGDASNFTQARADDFLQFLLRCF